MKLPASLTAVGNDWFPRNLAALQSSLRETDIAVMSRTRSDDDPVLDSPNLANLRGYMRWAILPKIIEQHMKVGKYPGVVGKWVSLGGVSVFEMEGDHTTLTAFHLKHEDEVPRDSAYRKNRRRLNAGPQCMLFPEEEQEAANASAKVHLTLVHGGQEAEFAYLRAYFDEDNRSFYHRVSANIMTMPVLLDDMETEQIIEPQIELGLKLNTGHFSKLI